MLQPPVAPESSEDSLEELERPRYELLPGRSRVTVMKVKRTSSSKPSAGKPPKKSKKTPKQKKQAPGKKDAKKKKKKASPKKKKD